jgi:hypothetical protein
MQRVRNLAHERLIASTGALLDDHQPHEALRRNGRAPTPTRRLLPRPLDRLKHRRIALNSTSRAARSSGSSRTSIGNAASNSGST